MPTLFDPIRLGGLDLPNRFIMAPLTRMRADPETRAPTALVAEQYTTEIKDLTARCARVQQWVPLGAVRAAGATAPEPGA